MNRLSEVLSRPGGLEAWLAWMASVALIALVTVVLNLVARVRLRHAASIARRTASVWDDALVQTASNRC